MESIYSETLYRGLAYVSPRRRTTELLDGFPITVQDDTVQDDWCVHVRQYRPLKEKN